MLYLTKDKPGVGGEIKKCSEDFFVEEIPLYEPTGQGQHIYVTLEKRGLSTYVAIRKIAQALNISPRRIGYAGLKDAHAVTRQTISISSKIDSETVANLNIPNIKILKVTRHRNKLRIGHLSGNRFVIRVRSVSESDFPLAKELLATLVQKGVPNFFGKQRFGNRGNTHRLGELILRNDQAEFVAEYLGRPQPHETNPIQAARKLIDDKAWEKALKIWPFNLSDERKVLRAIVQAEGQFDRVFLVLNKKLKRFFISAFQSYLFNQLLAQRLDSLDQIQVGDVAYLHNKGAAFVVEDSTREQPRADRFEISPAGPMFGSKLLQAREEPGRREQAILDQQGLILDDFKLPRLKIRGTRRPYRFKMAQAKMWWDDDLFVSFELPPGAYATTVMAEIMKIS